MTIAEISKKIAILNVVVFCVPTVLFAQTTYSDSQNNYSFQLPEGWEQIPQDVVDRRTAAAGRELMGKTIEYDAGFQLSEQGAFQYPYILLQEHDVSAPAYNQLERKLEESRFKEEFSELKDQFSKAVSDAYVGEPVIDKENAAILFNLGISTSESGDIKGLVAVMMGQDHSTRIYFYAREDNFSKWLPVFQSIVRSFSYDRGYAYESSEASTNSNETNQSMFSGTLRHGIVGLFVGGLFFSLIELVGLLRRNKRTTDTQKGKGGNVEQTAQTANKEKDEPVEQPASSAEERTKNDNEPHGDRWHRLFGAVSFILLLSAAAASAYIIFINNIPKQIVDYRSSQFTCLQGNEEQYSLYEVYTYGNNDIERSLPRHQPDERLKQPTDDEIIRLCELREQSDSSVSSNINEDHSNEEHVAAENSDFQQTLTEIRNMEFPPTVEPGETYTIERSYKLSHSWWKPIVFATLPFIGAALLFEVFRRMYFFVIYGTFRKPQ